MRRRMVNSLAAGLIRASEYDPEGVTPAELLANIEADPEGFEVHTPAWGDSWTVHRNVVLTAEERAAVLEIIRCADIGL